MEISTKRAIIGHLQDACYLFAKVKDKSPDELHAYDEVSEVLGHVKDIEVEGGL